MTHAKLARRLARPARDFLAGLLLFAGLSGSDWFASAAHARLFEVEPVEGMLEAVLALPTLSAVSLPALLCLGLSFALLVAVNMWLFRHLRQAHASYRRRR